MSSKKPQKVKHPRFVRRHDLTELLGGIRVSSALAADLADMCATKCVSFSEYARGAFMEALQRDKASV